MARRREFEKGAKLERLEANVDNPQKALHRIGRLMVRHSQSAFLAQRFGEKAWPARAVPNIFGIISDFKSGTKPKASRFQDRPVLIDTGRLMQSIDFRIAGRDSVVVFSGVRYAATQQEGGTTESKTISKSLQRRLWRWMKGERQAQREKRADKDANSDEVTRKLRALLSSLGKDDESDITKQLGWLLNKKFRGKRLTQKVEARPFLGLTADLEREILRVVGAEVLEAA